MGLTIGKKLNGLIVALQIGGIGFATYYATRVFRDDFVELMRTGTSNSATLFGSRIRAEMKEVADRASTLGAAANESFKFKEDKERFIQENLGVDAKYISLGLYRKDAGKPFKRAWGFVTIDSHSKFHIKAEEVVGLDQSAPLDFARLEKGGVDFRLGLIGETPVIRIGLPYVETEGKKNEFNQVLSVEMRQDRFSAFFKEVENYTLFLVDRDGTVLASSSENDPHVKTGKTLKDYPVVQKAFQETHNSGNFLFNDPSGVKHISAYQKVGFADLIVISQVPYALAAQGEAATLQRTSFLAGIFIFISLAFGAGISQSFTKPIRLLASAAENVRRGDFTVRLDAKASGDEIQQFASTFNHMVAGLQERDQIKTTFSKFHSKEIADKLLSGELGLGGEKKNAFVFFSDVRGFTTLSEQMNPETLVQILNRYMSCMVRVITDHGGVVDKYVGDAIMALWGVPLSKSDDGVRAVQACLEMRQALVELNQEFEKEGLPTLRIGMGLNFGSVIAGNIGSAERMEYTVIGDTVNTASRIESLTKVFGTDLLISQTVVNEIPNSFWVERTYEAKVKGKAEALVVYQVRGFVNEKGERHEIRTAYSQYTPEGGGKAAMTRPDPIALDPPVSPAPLMATAPVVTAAPRKVVPPPFRKPGVSRPAAVQAVHPSFSDGTHRTEVTNSGLFVGTATFNTGLFAPDKVVQFAGKPMVHAVAPVEVTPEPQIEMAPARVRPSVQKTAPSSSLLPDAGMTFNLNSFETITASPPSHAPPRAPAPAAPGKIQLTPPEPAVSAVTAPKKKVEHKTIAFSSHDFEMPALETTDGGSEAA